MNFKEYQEGTNKTNIYSDAIFSMLKPIHVLVYNSDDDDARAALSNLELILNIAYPLLGYAGEVSELLNKFKKVIRGDRSVDEFIDLSFDEQGDCLYYAAQVAEQTGYELEDVAIANNAKLSDRKDRGVIRGDGDKR